MGKDGITGYSQLSQEEIVLINEIKAKGAELLALTGKIGTINQQMIDEENSLVFASESFRWIAIAKTHIQEGVMAATRAVAKPEGI